MVKKWTSHKEAAGFRVPARNVQLPAIRNSFEQEREKKYVSLQSMIGAQSAIMLELWESISRLRDQQNQLIKAAKQALREKDNNILPGEEGIGQIVSGAGSLSNS